MGTAALTMPREGTAAAVLPDRPEKKRLLQLDILRGLAILLVLRRHPLGDHRFAGSLWRAYDGLYDIGWTGVDLFFVLSGFLVGGLLFQELRARGRLDVRRFIIRRGFKIWPSYILYVIFLFVLFWLTRGGGAAGALRALWPNFVHIQNYFPGCGHTWSLAVEEHFYLLLPLLLLLLTWRRSDNRSAIPGLPVVALAVLAGCLIVRLATPLPPGDYEDVWLQTVFSSHYAPTHCRIDSLFFGVLLAYFYNFKPGLFQALGRHRLLLLAIGVTLLAPFFCLRLKNDAWVVTLGFTQAYLGYGCILVAFVLTPIGEGWLGRALGSRPARALAFIGVYSYSTYLWHIHLARKPLDYMISHWGLLRLLPTEVRWLVFSLLYLLLALACGVVMGKLIEMPALALRDRLFPARAGLLARPPALAGRNEAV